MKTIILVILLLLNSQISISQESTNDTTHVFKLGFKGKVKKVEQERLEAIKNNGQIVPKKQLFENISYYENISHVDYMYEFNSSGNLIKVKPFFNELLIFGYNDDGEIIERSVYSMKGKLKGKWSFIYDSYGVQTIKTEYGNYENFSMDNLLFRLNIWNGGYNWMEKKMIFVNDIEVVNCDKYDIKGNCVEGYGYDLPSDFPGKFTRKYDDNGNMEETIFFKNNGEVYSSRNCKYDVFNHKVEDIKGEEKLFWTYDEKDRSVEFKKFKNDKLIIMYLTKYDDLGNIIKEEKIKYIYTSAGVYALKILAMHASLQDKSVNNYTRENEYDVHGNMIKRIEYENDKPTFITFRKFEFYD